MDHLHEICIFLHPIEAVQINAESSLHGHRLQHVQVLSTEKSPAGWLRLENTNEHLDFSWLRKPLY